MPFLQTRSHKLALRLPCAMCLKPGAALRCKACHRCMHCWCLHMPGLSPADLQAHSSHWQCPLCLAPNQVLSFHDP
jgi:hypothetical protein